MSRDVAAAALKSWSSWLRSSNSHHLSCQIHHSLLRTVFLFFFPFSIVRNEKSRPTFWHDFSPSVWPQIFNNVNCRYWKFHCQNQAKTKIETRLVGVLPIARTSGRLHSSNSEFVGFLFLQDHWETDRFFPAAGVQFPETDRDFKDCCHWTQPVLLQHRQPTVFLFLHWTPLEHEVKK